MTEVESPNFILTDIFGAQKPVTHHYRGYCMSKSKKALWIFRDSKWLYYMPYKPEKKRCTSVMIG